MADRKQDATAATKTIHVNPSPEHPSPASHPSHEAPARVPEGRNAVSQWREKPLGEFVRLQRGHDLTNGQRQPGNVPVKGSAGMNGYHDTAKAKGPGVVVGRSGASFGQVHYCPTDYWPHNTALYVTDFRGNDTRFTYYFLKSIDFSRYNSGSAQASLNRNFIYHIPVCIPEPDEQRAIASVMGSLDDKIELNRRMNETLEALAQSLFTSWFVDATQSALPKSWTERALYDCADYINGAAFRNEHFSSKSAS
jgi:restriction endonuclease S subunit